MEIKGIDVSSYQGKPDWKKVAAAGIKVALLRITERYGVDASFEHNFTGCRTNGIRVGVYKFSYALSVAEIQKGGSGGRGNVGRARPGLSGMAGFGMGEAEESFQSHLIRND